MKPHLHIAATPEAVALEFANFLQEKASEKQQLHIALSGGSTPQLLFDLLAKDFRHSIDWERIHFYWGDERCVPPTHDDSNYKMTKEHLFDRVPVPADHIHRIEGERPPAEEAERYGAVVSKNVPQANQLPRFDMIILGLGTDGHTASIFPHQMELLTAPNVCAVATHPDSGQKRVTLTGPVINNAQQVAFLVTGSPKRDKVKAILHHTGGWEKYPGSFINNTPGELHWFLDEAAGG